jgi:hypothetical protein
MNRIAAHLSIASFVLVSACSAEPPPDAARAAARPAPQTQAPAPDDPMGKMARAVGNGKPGAAVDIRYDFQAKPDVGVPAALEIAFIPRAGVDAIEARISGMPGVSVTGPLNAKFERVEPGKPYKHSVNVLPQQAGVYYLSVTVTTLIGGTELARTFSIPFVVGSTQASEKAAPETDASGEPIERMEAVEPGT